MLRATIDDVRMDTRLQLLDRYERFQLVLEHAGWKHQPVAWRVLWRDGAPIVERAQLRGSPAQLAAAERDVGYAAGRDHGATLPAGD